MNVGVCVSMSMSKLCAAWRHSINLACTACSGRALFAHRRREKPSLYITNWIEKLKKKRPAERVKEERNTEWGEGQGKREIENSCSYLSSLPSEEPRGRWKRWIWKILLPLSIAHFFLLNALLFLSLLSPQCIPLIVHFPNFTPLFSPLPWDSVPSFISAYYSSALLSHLSFLTSLHLLSHFHPHLTPLSGLTLKTPSLTLVSLQLPRDTFFSVSFKWHQSLHPLLSSSPLSFCCSVSPYLLIGCIIVPLLWMCCSVCERAQLCH